MTTTIKWVAHKRFKYGGSIVGVGDEWKPAGGKWDDSIKAHYVHIEEIEKRPTTRKKANDGAGSK